MKPKHSVNSTEIPPLLSGITTADKYLAVLAAHEDWHRCIVDDNTFIDKPNKVSRKTTHGYIQRQLTTDNKAEGEKFLEETEKIFADIVARFPGWQTPDPIICYRPKQGMYYRQLRFTYDENEKFMQVIPEYLAIINADTSKMDFVFDRYAAAKAKCCKFEHTTPSASVIKNKKASTFEYDYDTAISKFIASLASPEAKKTANHILKRHFEQFYKELFPQWVTEDITDTIDYYWVENNVFGGRTRETYYYTMNSHGECAVNLTELAGIYYQRLCSECGIQPSDTFLRMFYPILYNEIIMLKLKFGVLSGTSTESEKIIQNFQEKIWKDGFDSVSLRQLDNIINEIQNGTIETDTGRRLRQIANQSSRFQLSTTNYGRMVRYNYRPRSESVPIIAAQICGGSSGASYKGPHSYYRECCLVEWAKHADYWIEDIEKHAKIKGWKRAEELDGTESMIYTTPRNTIVKVWYMKNYAYNLSRGVEKIMLHNFLFGSDTYLSVMGFTKIKGFLYFILEQPIIDYIKESYNGIAIRKFLEKKFPNGHVDLVKGQFIVYLPEIIITDLHARNVVRTSKDSNNFHIIDCNIMFRSSNLGSLYSYYTCKVNPLTLNSISDLDDIISKANEMIDAFAYTGYYPRSHEEAMVQQYWKNIKKQCNQRKKELRRLMKSPLFKNEILLIKQKYKPTKNR